MGAPWTPPKAWEGSLLCIFEDEKGGLQILFFASLSSFNHLRELGSSFPENVGLTTVTCTPTVPGSCTWLPGDLTGLMALS